MTMYAICDTSGCGNQGAPIPVDPVGTVTCGVCSQPITDLTDTPPEQVTEMPPWEL